MQIRGREGEGKRVEGRKEGRGYDWMGREEGEGGGEGRGERRGQRIQRINRDAPLRICFGSSSEGTLL